MLLSVTEGFLGLLEAVRSEFQVSHGLDKGFISELTSSVFFSFLPKVGLAVHKQRGLTVPVPNCQPAPQPTQVH